MGIIASPNQVRRLVNEYAIKSDLTEFPQSKRGPIIKEIDTICGSSENRYIIFGWLFTPDEELMRPLHSSDLTAQQWYGLKRWFGVMNVGDDVDPEWQSRVEFPFEVQTTLTRAAYHWEVTQNRPIPIGRLVALPTEGEPDTLIDNKTKVDHKPYMPTPQAQPPLPSPEKEFEF